MMINGPSISNNSDVSVYVLSSLLWLFQRGGCLSLSSGCGLIGSKRFLGDAKISTYVVERILVIKEA
jgi:hypothetical protein